MADTNAQRAQMERGKGFIAALDQSGGSTPKALALYGVQPSDYSDDTEMFQAMHDMRARIILADDFTSAKVIGAILFERTMNETINGKPVADVLWSDRGVVPFLKIDKGLEAEANGVQLLKPMPGLDALLAEAKGKGIYGTKERSVINHADAKGVADIIAQQFDVASQVTTAGLVPIIEPEINIHSETKSLAEAMMKAEISNHLDGLADGVDVILKLTLPNEAGFYDSLADHPRVLRVVALSGGYSMDEASAKLAQNAGMIASFSRALTEGLDVKMSNAGFNTALGGNIDKIYRASI